MYDAGQDAWTDIDAAVAYAGGLVDETASNYGWSEAQLARAHADIGVAAVVADDASWWGSDVPTFYATLVDLAEAWDVPREDELQVAWGAAEYTADTVDAADDVATYAGYAADAVVETAEDLGAYVDDVAKVATSPWPYIGGGLLGLGLLAAYLL